MSGNHAMSARERRGSVWDIRWNDASGTLEATRETSPPSPLKNRILALRATLAEIKRIAERDLRPSPARSEICRRITNELQTLEWELLD